jgi:hypothetical protein
MLLETFDAARDIIRSSDLVEDLMEDRLRLCSIYAFIQGLIFYHTRLHSKSLEEYMTDLRRVREEVGILVDFDLAMKLHDINIRYHQQLYEI